VQTLTATAIAISTATAISVTITDRRNKLGIESIQAIECLKSWLGKNNIAYVEGFEAIRD
jgi:hypothetical protein